MVLPLSLVVTDSSRAPVTGEIPWLSITAEPRFNEVGAGSFTAVPSAALLTACTTPGNRIRLLRGDQVFLSGPIEVGQDIEFTADGASPLTVQWASSEADIAGELVYPDPTVAITAQVLESYIRTGVNAETILRDLANLNVGPGALVARRVPGLTIAASTGVGTTISIDERLTKLGDALRTAAVAGGDLGWRVRDTLSGLLFEVFDPTDRSAYVRFSFGRNNLRSLKVRSEAPKGTSIIVGDDGTGATRVFTETINVTDAAYGRREVLVNNDNATKAITDNAAKTTLAAEGVDTPQQTYGVDLNLGDIVGVEDAYGRSFADVVTAAKLSADAEKDPHGTVAVTIGTGHPSVDAAATDQLRRLTREVDRLMRS